MTTPSLPHNTVKPRNQTAAAETKTGRGVRAKRGMLGGGLAVAAVWVGAVASGGAARAQDPSAELPAQALTTLPTVEVVGVSPLLGSGIDPDKVPANLRILSQHDLSSEGVPDLSGTLQRRLSSVTLTDVEGNPFQPNIQFRGFDASPVIGTPQGLAVYQNGVRINEAFGDTVNWDVIPEAAINRLNLVTGNPVFGLNALGGALSLEMKNGFTFRGLEAEAHGGSFGRRAGSLQYGVQAGDFASYIAADALNNRSDCQVEIATHGIAEPYRFDHRSQIAFDVESLPVSFQVLPPPRAIAAAPKRTQAVARVSTFSDAILHGDEAYRD